MVEETESADDNNSDSPDGVEVSTNTPTSNFTADDEQATAGGEEETRSDVQAALDEQTPEKRREARWKAHADMTRNEFLRDMGTISAAVIVAWISNMIGRLLSPLVALRESGIKAPEIAAATEEVLEHLVGDTKVKIVTYKKGEGLKFLSVHDDENTSTDVARAFIDEKGGQLVELQHTGQRNLSFELAGTTYTIDPNRIFTEAGIKEHLEPYSEQAEEAVTVLAAAVIKALEIDEPSEETIVAVHNNTDQNYSAGDYKTGGKHASDAVRATLIDGVDTDDFFFVTALTLYQRLKATGKVNVILQDNDRANDDGSFSIFCGDKGISYVNVEAQHGHGAEQAEMIRILEEALASTKELPELKDDDLVEEGPKDTSDAWDFKEHNESLEGKEYVEFPSGLRLEKVTDQDFLGGSDCAKFATYNPGNDQAIRDQCEFYTPFASKAPLLKVPLEIMGKMISDNFKVWEAVLIDPKDVRRGLPREEYTAAYHNSSGRKKHVYTMARLDPEHIRILQRVRTEANVPIVIDEGYRSFGHNWRMYIYDCARRNDAGQLVDRKKRPIDVPVKDPECDTHFKSAHISGKAVDTNFKIAFKILRDTCEKIIKEEKPEQCKIMTQEEFYKYLGEFIVKILLDESKGTFGVYRTGMVHLGSRVRDNKVRDYPGVGPKRAKVALYGQKHYKRYSGQDKKD